MMQFLYTVRKNPYTIQTHNYYEGRLGDSEKQKKTFHLRKMRRGKVHENIYLHRTALRRLSSSIALSSAGSLAQSSSPRARVKRRCS